MKKIYTLLLFSFTTVFTFGQYDLDLILFSDAGGDGFNRPCELVNAGDGRLFLVEQAGRIFILNPDGSHNETPFLDISDQVQSTGGEQGLLGLAFDPNSGSAEFYVNYTTTFGDSTFTRISRFLANGINPDLAIPGSEEILMEIWQPFTNHNGGHIEFGADGYLYIGMGDGGSTGDPLNMAQNLSSNLGKMLRIDVSGDEYTIPTDNPFIEVDTINPEIWSYGLRNPWKFTFDPETDDLWIADVGQNQWEEINFEPADSEGGINYGWKCREGAHDYSPGSCEFGAILTDPVFEYSHGGGHCSVSGGKVYRGTEFSELNGKYIFADYCSGSMWLNWFNEEDEIESYTQSGFGFGIVGFGEDVNNNLYVINGSTGNIYRLQGNCDSITVDISNDQNVLTTEAEAISYLWYFNDQPIPDSDTPVIVADSSGAYYVEITTISACTIQSDVIEINLTSIEDPGYISSLTLYPNPAGNSLNLELDLLQKGDYNIMVHDNKGRLILADNLNSTFGNTNYHMDIENYPAGLYLLKILSKEDVIAVRKFIKR